MAGEPPSNGLMFVLLPNQSSDGKRTYNTQSEAHKEAVIPTFFSHGENPPLLLNHTPYLKDIQRFATEKATACGAVATLVNKDICEFEFHGLDPTGQPYTQRLMVIPVLRERSHPPYQVH